MLAAPLLVLALFQSPANAGPAPAAQPIDSRTAVLGRVNALCPTWTALDRDALLKAEKELATLKGTRQRAAVGTTHRDSDWMGLACTSARLSFLDPPLKERWGVVIPDSWANRAIDALVYALNIRPDHSVAAELLAAIAIDATETPQRAKAEVYEDIGEALQRAVLFGVRVSAVTRGCTSYALVRGDTAGARFCSDAALRYGTDSTWHLLRWALVASRHDDSAGASKQLKNAIGAAITPRSSGELAATLGASPSVAAFAAPASAADARVCEPTLLPLNCREADPPHRMNTLRMHTALSRIWDPRTLRPIGLLTYGLSRADLVDELRINPETGEPIFVQHQRVPTLDLTFRQWESDTGQLRYRTARIEVIDALKNTGWATGFLFVPSSETTTSWSMMSTSWQGRRGRVAEDYMTPLDTGPLVISDPVIGARRDSVTWTLNGRDIALSPLDAIYQGEGASLYYQVRSDTRREKMSTIIRFYRTGGAKGAPPTFQVSFETPVESGLTEIQRQFDVSRLERGAYRLEVAVEDPTTGAVSRQSRRISVQ